MQMQCRTHYVLVVLFAIDVIPCSVGVREFTDEQVGNADKADVLLQFDRGKTELQRVQLLGKGTDAVNRTQTKVEREGWIMMMTDIGRWRPKYIRLYDDGSFSASKFPDAGKERQLKSPLLHSMVVDGGVQSKSETIYWFQVVAYLGDGFAAPFPEIHFFGAHSEEEKQSWKNAIEAVGNSQTVDETELLQSGTLEANSLDDFEMLKVLSKSTASNMWLAKLKSDGKEKLVTLMDPKWLDLTKVALPQVPALQFAPTWEKTLKTPDRHILVEGNAGTKAMFILLNEKRAFTEEQARFYGAELAVFLENSHSKGIRYPSLALESVYLDNDGHVVVRTRKVLEPLVKNSLINVKEYTSPEMLEDGVGGYASNWWAYGVIMYELLCGRLPFYNRDAEVLFDIILTEDPRFPSTLSSVAQDFLGSLLEKEPNLRLVSESVMKHEFFQSVNWDDASKRRLQPPFTNFAL